MTNAKMKTDGGKKSISQHGNENPRSIRRRSVRSSAGSIGSSFFASHFIFGLGERVVCRRRLLLSSLSFAVRRRAKMLAIVRGL